MSRFTLTENVRYRRSKFDLSKDIKSSMSVGRLYPLDVQEVLPGDTFQSKLGVVFRLSSSFLKPVMDNAWLDIYHFFVPYRLVYDDFEGVFGNPNPSSYVDNTLKSIPQFDSDGGYFTIPSGTVGDYLGLPVGQDKCPKNISVLPFRAFAKIYNDWFRDEANVDEVYINKDTVAPNETPNSNEWSANNYVGKLPFVRKKKDYFTSCLPAPQKGQPVPLGLIGDAPVKVNPELKEGIWTHPFLSLSPASDPSKIGWLLSESSVAGSTPSYQIFSGDSVSPSPLTLTDNALKADLTSVGGTINDFMFAYQLSRILNRDSRFGSRYQEFLLASFGVSSPDSRLQLSEYLGGGRIPLNVQQVHSTAPGTEESALGELGAFSHSQGYSRYSKSFVEHGLVITVGCIRTMHTYSQGVEKFWLRSERKDFYDPLLANLPEQPVYTQELYCDSSVNKDDIFGWQEAWADYRYAPSRITGQMRSGVSNSLDIWHFGDYYSSKPYLSSDFIQETPTFFDRTISVPQESQDAFILDMYLNTKATRVMPLYSVPSLNSFK